MADVARLGVVAHLPEQDSRAAGLEIGSDAEIARRVLGRLRLEFDNVVFAEGHFHTWSDGYWRVHPKARLVDQILHFDGALYPTSKGGQGCVRLGKQRIESILFVMSSAAAAPDFFHHPKIGINCASGFITFDADGGPRLEPHSPYHRQRHKLPARWRIDQTLRPGPLLDCLLEGCFRDDLDQEEKGALLAEVAGAVALGIGTRLKTPKAIVLHGPSAANGKSQILSMLRSLLPPGAVTSVPPRKFGDDRHIVRLAGALLNTADELGDAAVFGEQFKAVITGDRLAGRDVYKSGVDFRPLAIHVLAGNRFPVFTNGMDAGVRRRLLVVPFNRTIPEKERLEDIGSRIGLEEPDQLLAWAVFGASRLIQRGGFLDLPSSREAVAEWVLSADCVGSWLSDAEQVAFTNDPADAVAARAAYGQFRVWCEAEGIQRIHVPHQAGFTQRVAASGRGIEKVRAARGAIFRGMRLVRGDVR